MNTAARTRAGRLGAHRAHARLAPAPARAPNREPGGLLRALRLPAAADARVGRRDHRAGRAVLPLRPAARPDGGRRVAFSSRRRFSWRWARPGLTVLFGRYLCGWVCPLGAVHQFFSFLFKKTRAHVPTHKETRLLHVKYAVLAATVAGSIFTLDLAGFLDPLSLLTRSFAVAVLPAFVATGDAAAAAAGDCGLDVVPAASRTGPVEPRREPDVPAGAADRDPVRRLRPAESPPRAVLLPVSVSDRRAARPAGQVEPRQGHGRQGEVHRVPSVRPPLPDAGRAVPER